MNNLLTIVNFSSHLNRGKLEMGILGTVLLMEIDIRSKRSHRKLHHNSA